MRRANGNVTGWALAAACVAVSPASATWTPGQLFGDSYIVREGDHVYSVLDVYIKCSSSADIISSVFGVTAYTSDFSLSGGKVFAQSIGASAAAWLPVNNDGSAWDSFVTCGCRVQGSNTALVSGQAGFLGMQLDTNWAPSSSGAEIVGQAGGAGWYPSIGASTTTNPYAKAGQYSGTGPVNTAKCTKTISGNGIAIGQSLSNYWMIGRFSIDVVEDDVGVSQSMGLRFAVAGKNSGTTTFPCGPGPCAANRFDWTLTFAPRPCIGDIDSDGLCDGWDLGLLLLDFGPCPACPTDIDGNGTVDPGDMSLLLMDWNAPC